MLKGVIPVAVVGVILPTATGDNTGFDTIPPAVGDIVPPAGTDIPGNAGDAAMIP